jgi:hypothetical protein
MCRKGNMWQIISMGDVGTGKSCLIKRYCEEKVRARRFLGAHGVECVGSCGRSSCQSISRPLA